MFAASTIGRGFESRQTKDYNRAALNSKNNDVLALNQETVSEWHNISTVVSVSKHYKNLNKRGRLVKSGYHHHLI